MRNFAGVFVALTGVLLSNVVAEAAPILVSFNQTLVIDPYPANDFKSVDLDLNNDGTPDVRITHESFRLTHTNFADSYDTAIGLNGAMLLTSGGFGASLAPGQTVGPAGSFTASGTTLIDTEYYRDGHGNTPANTAFLNSNVAIGMQIPVGGNNFYAWLGVQSKGNTNGVGTNMLLLHDYGYETVPNTAAVAQAPEPASAALLGVAGAMTLLRRSQRQSRRSIQWQQL